MFERLLSISLALSLGATVVACDDKKDDAKAEKKDDAKAEKKDDAKAEKKDDAKAEKKDEGGW